MSTVRWIGEPLEKDIQKAVQDYLWIHPKVAKVIRINRGAMTAEYTSKRTGQTKRRYIEFNDAEGHSDVYGWLKGGRAFFIEIKRPKKQPTEKQANFLVEAWDTGCLAGVARSIEDASRILQGDPNMMTDAIRRARPSIDLGRR